MSLMMSVNAIGEIIKLHFCWQTYTCPTGSRGIFVFPSSMQARSCPAEDHQTITTTSLKVPTVTYQPCIDS